MKSISRLKITQLSKAELGKRELNRLVGGENCCICGCLGSSSSFSNSGANYNGGKSGLITPPGIGGGTGSYG